MNAVQGLAGALSSSATVPATLAAVLAAITAVVAFAAAHDAAGRAAVRRRCHAEAVRLAGPGGSARGQSGEGGIRAPSVAGRLVAAAPWHRQAELARRRAELPRALDALGRSLRSGASVRTAFSDLVRNDAAIAPTLRADLESIVTVLDADLGLADALRRWTERRADPDVRFVAGALAVGAAAGSLTSRSVDEVASVLRGRLDAAAESRGLAVQAQFSAVVMVLAPLLFLAFVAVADRAVATVVLTTPIGWICVASGLLLDVGAGFAMRRIVRSVR